MKIKRSPVRLLLLIAGLSLPVFAPFLSAALSPPPAPGGGLKVMVLTGQCSQSHDWTKSSPILTEMLEASGLFEVDAVITPPKGSDLSGFAPRWAEYDVVVMDYEGDEWPEETKEAFAEWVSAGGGLVSFHATDNAFPKWPAFLEMTGVGGWAGRDAGWGPWIHWTEGGVVRDESPGGAMHPPKHDFLVVTRAPEHPVMQGLPDEWLHAHDELYSRLRGPAQNLTVLATAYADPERFAQATGRHEPMLMAIHYGKGRVFHTTLGHVGTNDEEPIRSVRCVGFITTLLRGTEWAATGEVTQDVPDDFPTAETTSIRATGD